MDMIPDEEPKLHYDRRTDTAINPCFIAIISVSLYFSLSEVFLSGSHKKAEGQPLYQGFSFVELDAAQTELYLGLCWGNPQEYQYQWAKPDSGYHRIIAAKDEPSVIKI